MTLFLLNTFAGVLVWAFEEGEVEVAELAVAQAVAEANVLKNF